MLFPRDRTRLGFVASPAAEPPEEEVPIAPILTLLPASDLGSTSGDHISNDPFPQMAADFDDAAQAGETVRVYLDAGDTAGATLHDSFVLTSEMLSGGTVPAGTFDAIPAGAWLVTITHANTAGESPHSNAEPYTMNQSLGPVALSVGVSDQTADTTPDVVLDLSGATVLAGDHAEVIAADGTVLGTADLTTATIASCPVTLSSLAQGAHTVRGYVWRDDGTFTELQSYTFTVNAALAISGTPVLTATEDSAYAGFTASATGGVTPYVFSLVGTWPAGISVDSGTGVVSGTPTESGSFASLSVRVTDDEGSTDDLATFTLEVAAAAPAFALTFTDDAVDPSDSAAYTFAGMSFGAADATRRIIVGIAARHGSNLTQSLGTVTIGGVTASVVKQSTSTGGGGWEISAIVIADVPTGTTGDVVVNITNGTTRCGIAVWSMIGASSGTASATGSHENANPLTGNLNIPTNGVAVGIATGTGGTSAAWTNLTERVDAAMESTVLYSAADATFTTGGVTALTCTWSVSPSAGPTFAFATWAP